MYDHVLIILTLPHLSLLQNRDNDTDFPLLKPLRFRDGKLRGRAEWCYLGARLYLRNDINNSPLFSLP